ncbi:MAG: hypothetical protein ACK5MZ_12425 [Aestuariibaculum sp.]
MVLTNAIHVFPFMGRFNNDNDVFTIKYNDKNILSNQLNKSRNGSSRYFKFFTG